MVTRMRLIPTPGFRCPIAGARSFATLAARPHADGSRRPARPPSRQRTKKLPYGLSLHPRRRQGGCLSSWGLCAALCLGGRAFAAILYDVGRQVIPDPREARRRNDRAGELTVILKPGRYCAR